MPLNEYKTKEQFIADYQSLFTERQFDWFIRQRANNGLDESGALMKISNRWYVHTDKFTQWFSSHTA
ncbi:MAG TPA: hypothetical protein EYM96_09920 [Rhodospirillales bacterium]|nr:hypothetical protein [Rhodospirillales bacterium]